MAFLKVLAIFACYGLALWPAGWLVGRLTRSWRDEIGTNDSGLTRGGFWIGCLERFLAISFMVAGQYEAIGFLVAAKSILWFGAVRGASAFERRISEYIIIGTLLSLAVTLPLGACARWAWTSLQPAAQEPSAIDLGAIRDSIRDGALKLEKLREATERLERAIAPTTQTTRASSAPARTGVDGDRSIRKASRP